MFKKTSGRNFSGTLAIDREDEEMTIYANVEGINSNEVCRETEDTRRNQTPQHTGSECVKKRSPRSVLVCLVVLCVFLLTAVIVLCVLIYTNNHQCHINNKHITQERDRLLTNNTKLTQERDQLLTNNTKLTQERDQLLTNNTKLIEDRDQLLTNNTKLTEDRNQLNLKYINMMKEKDELLSNKNNLSKQKEQLNQQINKLWSILRETDGWIYYQSSFYFISFEKKSWSESRRYCRERGADLAIINNNEKQNFVQKYSCSKFIWIGLSDSEEEGRWKWVDGSTMTNSFFRSPEPNGGTNENCVMSSVSSWIDQRCSDSQKWICERKLVNVAK